MPTRSLDPANKLLISILRTLLTKNDNWFESWMTLASSHQPEDETNTDSTFPSVIWQKMFTEAERHLLLPIICKSIHQKDFVNTLSNADKKLFEDMSRIAAKEVLGQYKRTAAFLDLYEYLTARGIKPLVLKGIVCRSLYPDPEYRQSWDEDILVAPTEFEKCHKALIQYGMQLETNEKTLHDSYEVIYKDITSHLILEVHKTVFAADTPVFCSWNRYFSDVFDCCVAIDIIDAGEMDSIWTLPPQDHLFYLICHTFKHFLYFGAGLRQVLDILMYSSSYGDQIDWQLLQKCCKQLRADVFTAGLYAIGEKYLGFDVKSAGVPRTWIDMASEPDDLLFDILDAGMQANTTKSRIHSSNMTLDAVRAEITGHTRQNRITSILKSVFPPLKSLRTRYTYLNQYPFLLPLAWGQRILRYNYETQREGEQREFLETLQTGNERIFLLQSQGIIASPTTSKTTKQVRKAVSLTSISSKVKDWGNHFGGGHLIPAANVLWKMAFRVQWKYLEKRWKKQGFQLPSITEQEDVKKQVTFIYKSFERQDMAIELYKNIQFFYPGARVIVADDSRKPLRFKAPYLSILQLPFNSGLCYGLTKALEQVKTPFVMRMDDDELLTRRTKLGEQLKFLQCHPEADIVTFGFITIANHNPKKAVWPDYFEQNLELASRKLLIRHMTKLDEGHTVLGKGPNIYLARTDAIRKVGYDSHIRMLDHHDFFMRAAGVLVTVGALDCFVFHRHNPFDADYRLYRGDLKADRDYLREKYNVSL